MVKQEYPILLFDGVCNFCDNTVQFVIKRNDSIHFASLQSSFGQEQLERAGLPTGELKSLIFIENGKIYTRSTGALRLARHLKGLWKVSYIFIVIPKPIRDFFYDIVAKNRYKWFGEKDACMLPSKEVRERFVEV